MAKQPEPPKGQTVPISRVTKTDFITKLGVSRMPADAIPPEGHITGTDR